MAEHPIIGKSFVKRITGEKRGENVTLMSFLELHSGGFGGERYRLSENFHLLEKINSN